MTTALQLESFDAPGAAVAAAPAMTEPEGYQDGYIAGVAAAEATMSAAQERLQETFVAAVQDAALTQAAAAEQVVAAMTPLLDAMITKVLPATRLPALCATLQQHVSAALADDAQAPLTLRVAPEHQSAVLATLGDTTGPSVQIHADPTLEGVAAWIVTPKGETALDYDAVLAAIADQLQGLQAVSEEGVQYG